MSAAEFEQMKRDLEIERSRARAPDLDAHQAARPQHRGEAGTAQAARQRGRRGGPATAPPGRSGDATRRTEPGADAGPSRRRDGDGADAGADIAENEGVVPAPEAKAAEVAPATAATGGAVSRAAGRRRLMGMLAWVMMGLALWHFTIWLPDRYWGGIVGAFIGALIGAALFGLIVNGFVDPRPPRHASVDRARGDSRVR